MNKKNYSRREFIKQNSLAGLGAAVALGVAPTLSAQRAGEAGTPAILGGRKISYRKYLERNQCPVNDRLCEEAVWFGQNMLLAEKSDMDDIAAAIERIHNNADKIKG